MEKIPEKVNSLCHNGNVWVDVKHIRHLCYTINKGEDTEMSIRVLLPQYHRLEQTEDIIEKNNDFINGFKAVKTANGEYAYIRESDNVLLPYRYDIALDFNDYGFAMVGKDGKVSWINKNFEYLNIQGTFVREEFYQFITRFNGWQNISSFSESDIPLSRLYEGRNRHGEVMYMGTNGQLQQFYKYNGEIEDYLPCVAFCKGTTFDGEGHAHADGKILFSKGYYVTYEDLIKMSIEKGFANTISEHADKCMENQKILTKSYKMSEK